MQKWEYKVIAVLGGSFVDVPPQTGLPSEAGIVVGRAENRNCTADLLNSMGNDGWELVSAARDFIFKRPKR